MKRLCYIGLPLLMLTCLFTSCSKDDDNEVLPAYATTFGEIDTNSAGLITTLRTDQGEHFSVTDCEKAQWADTTLRVLVRYLQTEQTANILSYVALLAPPADTYPEAKRKTDPVGLLSMWKGGNYINLRLRLQGTNNGLHYFGFHKSLKEVAPDGSQKWHIQLLHDQNNDELKYSRETFLSLPLAPLGSELQAGRDSVEVEVNTFNGWAAYAFAL